jgi:hypothetical protein
MSECPECGAAVTEATRPVRAVGQDLRGASTTCEKCEGNHCRRGGRVPRVRPSEEAEARCERPPRARGPRPVRPVRHDRCARNARKGPAYHRCPEHADVAIMEGWAEVLSIPDAMEAKLIEENLLASGIEARVLSQKDHSAFPVDLGDLARIRVLAPTYAYEEARREPLPPIGTAWARSVSAVRTAASHTTRGLGGVKPAVRRWSEQPDVTGVQGGSVEARGGVGYLCAPLRRGSGCGERSRLRSGKGGPRAALRHEGDEWSASRKSCRTASRTSCICGSGAGSSGSTATRSVTPSTCASWRRRAGGAGGPGSQRAEAVIYEIEKDAARGWGGPRAGRGARVRKQVRILFHRWEPALGRVARSTYATTTSDCLSPTAAT